MRVLEYHKTADPAFWLRQIGKSDWRAGRYLAELLGEGRFHEYCGSQSRLLLLTEGSSLLSFCTYAERDDLPTDLTPWIGFVYTFPEARGKRRMGKLFEHAYALAARDGFPCIYISTGETGLYEKYGCKFWKMMKDHHGADTRIYRMEIVRRDYSGVIGRKVSGVIDRPIGSTHPDDHGFVYPVNYGYIDGIMGGDGEPQDVYLLGPDQPLPSFAGTVIAVLHRLNDTEDKWIVTPDGARLSKEQILNAIAFQEQYFMGELYL